VPFAAAAALLDQPALVAPGRGMAASLAAKAAEPAGPHHIRSALGIAAEALEEARQVPGQILQQRLDHGGLKSCSFCVRCATAISPSTAGTHPA